MTVTTRVRRFYGPHNTVPCPDCGQPCDADFGDHHGTCRPPSRHPGSDIIHTAARGHQFLSINTVRAELIAAGVPESGWGRAFRTACEAGWLEIVGTEVATGAQAGRRVKRYRSLIHREPGQ